MNWLKKLFSSSNGVSSKRVFGAIAFTAMLVKVCMMEDANLIMWVFGLACGLLGLETVMNAFNKKLPDPDASEESTTETTVTYHDHDVRESHPRE